MADAVVTDSAKTVVFDDRNAGRTYGPAWAAEPVFGQAAEAMNVGNQTSHILNALLSQFGFVRDGIGRIGSDIRDSAHMVDKSVCDARDAIRQEGGASRETTLSAAAGLQTVLGSQHSTVLQVLTRGFCDVSKDVLASQSSLQLQAANISADTRQQIADFKQSIEKQLAECCCENQGDHPRADDPAPPGRPEPRQRETPVGQSERLNRQQTSMTGAP